MTRCATAACVEPLFQAWFSCTKNRVICLPTPWRATSVRCRWIRCEPRAFACTGVYAGQNRGTATDCFARNSRINAFKAFRSCVPGLLPDFSRSIRSIGSSLPSRASFFRVLAFNEGWPRWNVDQFDSTSILSPLFFPEKIKDLFFFLICLVFLGTRSENFLRDWDFPYLFKFFGSVKETRSAL